MTATLSPLAPPVLPAGVVDAIVSRATAGRFGGPYTFDEQWKTAEGLARARRAVPPMYRDSPGDVFAAIQQAYALDVPIMIALTQFYWAEDSGKGGMSAQLMSSLLLRHGVTWMVTEKNETRVKMIFSRSDDKPGGPVQWTILEAVAAGLIKPGSPWEAYPVDCLWARCLSRGARQYAADAVLGMGYTPEELYSMSSADTDATVDDSWPVKPDVQALLDGLGEATADDIQHVRFAAARTQGLLVEHAGMLDGSPQQLQQVLHNAWLAASHREAAAAADAALPTESPDDTAGPADVAVTESAPPSAGEGRLACGCGAQAVLRAGEHQEGCRDSTAH